MPGLEFDGWATGHGKKDFASFLENVMGLTEDEKKKVIKAVSDGRRSGDISNWCHLAFSGKAIKKAISSDPQNISSQYRAFVIKMEEHVYYTPEATDSQRETEQGIIRALIQDEICGKTTAEKTPYTIVKDNKAWYEISSSDNLIRTAWDAIIKDVWNVFNLQGKKIPFNANRGKIKWHKCTRKVGTDESEMKDLYLHLGNAIPSTAEEIPFIYVFLEQGRLIQPRDPTTTKKEESSFLVIVAQHKKGETKKKKKQTSASSAE